MKCNAFYYLITAALLILGILLGGWDAQGAAAQGQSPWAESSSLPAEMMGNIVRCSNFPSSFYFIAQSPYGGTTEGMILRHSISTGRWEALTPRPQGVEALFATVCYQGKIYLAGGTPGGELLKSFYIYDIATDSWSQGPDLPTPVGGAALGAWEGKLYLAGGERGVWFTSVNRVDVYDIASGAWTAGGGTAIPVATSYAGSAQVGPYLYVVGGFSDVEPVNVNQTLRYDMRTDTWEVGPTLANPRSFVALAATSSHLYLIGGDMDGGGIVDFTSLVEALDLSAWPGGEWVELEGRIPWSSGYLGTTCSEVLSSGEIWDVGGAALSGALRRAYYLPVGESCPHFSFGDLMQEQASRCNDPGGVVHFELPVYNAGTDDDTFDITVSASDWAVSLPADTGLIAPGNTALVTVDVSIPGKAVPGESVTLVVTITSQTDSTSSDSATLTVGAAGCPHHMLRAIAK